MKRVNTVQGPLMQLVNNNQGMSSNNSATTSITDAIMGTSRVSPVNNQNNNNYVAPAPQQQINIPQQHPADCGGLHVRLEVTPDGQQFFVDPQGFRIEQMLDQNGEAVRDENGGFKYCRVAPPGGINMMGGGNNNPNNMISRSTSCESGSFSINRLPSAATIVSNNSNPNFMMPQRDASQNNFLVQRSDSNPSFLVQQD